MAHEPMPLPAVDSRFDDDDEPTGNVRIDGIERRVDYIAQQQFDERQDRSRQEAALMGAIQGVESALRELVAEQAKTRELVGQLAGWVREVDKKTEQPRQQVRRKR